MVVRVTERQNRAFLLANPDALVRLIQDDVRERSPELVADLDPQSYREMVQNAVARARRHGLTDPQDLAGFAAVSFEIAPNFDEHPRIRRALADARHRPPPVFEALTEAVDDAAWAEAEAAYDERAWFSEFAGEDGA